MSYMNIMFHISKPKYIRFSARSSPLHIVICISFHGLDDIGISTMSRFYLSLMLWVFNLSEFLLNRKISRDRDMYGAWMVREVLAQSKMKDCVGTFFYSIGTVFYSIPDIWSQGLEHMSHALWPYNPCFFYLFNYLAPGSAEVLFLVLSLGITPGGLADAENWTKVCCVQGRYPSCCTTTLGQVFIYSSISCKILRSPEAQSVSIRKGGADLG